MLVRKGIMQHACQIQVEYDSMAAVSVSKELMQTDSDIIFLDPVDSPYYRLLQLMVHLF